MGLAYFKGEFCVKNNHKALAWFRESVRNGNPVSYLNAAEILNSDSHKNRLFSLVNYLGAYQHGAIFTKENIETLRNELINIEGIRIPEIKYWEPKDL